jgi:hypothetical protein
MNLCDDLKIEILRDYLNNDLRGSEIIVGSVGKNHATLIGIARPGKLWAELYSQISESEQSKPFQKHCKRWDMLVIANLLIASLAMRVLLENSKARVLPS